jgi:hypothetical protein
MSRIFTNDSAFSMDVSVENVSSYDSVQTTKYSIELTEFYPASSRCVTTKGISDNLISLLLKENYDIDVDDIRNAFPEKFI